MTLDTMANIYNHHARVHLTNNKNNNSPLVFYFITLLVYSSFVRVATSGFRIIPYSLLVVVVSAQIRSGSGIIPYSLQHGIIIALVTSSDYWRPSTYGTNIHSESQYT